MKYTIKYKTAMIGSFKLNIVDNSPNKKPITIEMIAIVMDIFLLSCNRLVVKARLGMNVASTYINSC